METLNHRSFLLRISEDITKEKLEAMKYLCMDCISEGKLETITSPLQLFKELERLKKMDIDNLSFLRELLENVRCLELAGRVNDFNLRRELGLLFLKEQRKQPRYRQDLNDTAVECLVMEASREDQLLKHTGALKKKALGECLSFLRVSGNTIKLRINPLIEFPSKYHLYCTRDYGKIPP